MGRWFCRCFVLSVLRMLFLIDCRRLTGSLSPIGSRISSGDRSTRSANQIGFARGGLHSTTATGGHGTECIPLQIMPLAGSAGTPLLSHCRFAPRGSRCWGVPDDDGSPKGFLCRVEERETLPQWGKGTLASCSPKRRPCRRQRGEQENETATRPSPKGEATDETASPQEETARAQRESQERGAPGPGRGDAVLRKLRQPIQSHPKRGCRAPVGHSGSHERPTPNKGQCGRGQQKHGANERAEDASREPRTAV